MSPTKPLLFARDMRLLSWASKCYADRVVMDVTPTYTASLAFRSVIPGTCDINVWNAARLEVNAQSADNVFSISNCLPSGGDKEYIVRRLQINVPTAQIPD